MSLDAGTLAVRTSGLTKSFGGRTVVDDVDLAVPTGSRYGFLGPNGSGKTTTVRMLLGLVTPDHGEVELLGRSMPGARLTVLPRVGALVEGPAAYPHLSATANLRLLDAAGPGPRRGRADRVDRVLALVGLAGVGRKKVRAYSLGMRQRLGLAAALLGAPELLVLDEPTNGLDPQGIREMRELLVGLTGDGVTVLVSSHLLAEVELLCTRVGVLDAGRLVVQSDLADITAPTGVVRVITPDPATAARVLDIDVVHADGPLLHVRGEPDAVTRRLVAAGARIDEVGPLRRTLEDMVLEVTGAGSDRVDGVRAGLRNRAPR